MASVFDHYETHLARVYAWSVGGIDAALARGSTQIAALQLQPGLAVDLGAGFGTHSIPLARSGWQVLAIDSSARLLEELRSHSDGLPITALQDDLRHFSRYLQAPADLILCMGDTLTHLNSSDDIQLLFREVARSLGARGRFVASFRDYRELPEGEQRFIPVRSDRDRIHTCFLERSGEHVMVHDLLHEYQGAAWTTRISSYPKLRLSPELVSEAAKAAGLYCRCESLAGGMLMIQAHV